MRHTQPLAELSGRATGFEWDSDGVADDVMTCGAFKMEDGENPFTARRVEDAIDRDNVGRRTRPFSEWRKRGQARGDVECGQD